MACIARLRRVVLLPLWLALGAPCLPSPASGASGEYDKAIALLKEGRPAEALPLLQAAREQRPGDPDVVW